MQGGGLLTLRPGVGSNYFRNNFVRHVGAAKHGSSYPWGRGAAIAQNPATEI
jgi:hypothetical protein